MSSSTSSTEWAPEAVPFYRPTLLAAMAACLLGIVGSLGPWMQVMVFTVNGLDASWWGVATLTMSVISALALIAIFLWDRTPLEPRFSVPLAWLVVVLAIASGAIATPFVIRIHTAPRASIFGASIGPTTGWGLWLLVFAAILQAGTAAVVAVHLSNCFDRLTLVGESHHGWTNRWRVTAGVCAAAVVLCSVTYFTFRWDLSAETDGSSAHEQSSFPSVTMPLSPPSSTPPTRRIDLPPQTPSTNPAATADDLSAATAVEQRKMDRRVARDFAGEWLLYTKALRNGISQYDYAYYADQCTPTGLGPITVTGLWIDVDGRAIVRTEILGVFSKTRMMSFEDGAWYQVPDDFLLTNLGKTGPELVAADKALGHCVS
ncbi:hypothetical protein [Mycobacterium sp.]|uniref:hypothetical protein n=1 Tax=Mycobacterium sp. TaxID=1785 RepID=UPI00257B7F4A|nr:hypothetical protein [Mycobacterium sp.]